MDPEPNELKQFEKFTGTYATVSLVGRKDIVAKIKKAITAKTGQPCVVFFYGPGGIGKTRILNEALDIAREMNKNTDSMLIASTSVDFYHVTNHTRNGLANALYGVLTPPKDPFDNYLQEHRALSRMWLGGEVTGVAEQIQKEINAFEQDMVSISQKRTVILAFDTLEKVLYGSLEGHPGILNQAEGWSWLVKSLSSWGNVVLFVAGRPESYPLFEMPDSQPLKDILKVEVGSFSPEETEDYLRTIEKEAEKHRDNDTALRVQALTPDLRRAIHYYSNGHPILLALLVDYMLNAPPGQVPDLFYRPFENIRKQTGQLIDFRQALEGQLVARLRTTPRIGDTILALGRLPKGADVKLLSKVADISTLEASRWLEEIQRYSFVKVRPSDERVFLHDEMYAILNRQIFNQPVDAPEAGKAEEAILAYYKERNAEIRGQLNELYKPVEIDKRDRLDLVQAAEIHADRRDLLTEIAYYRLRQDAERGYMRCYRYMREAVLTGDLMLYIQIQTEIQAFLSEKDANGQPVVIDEEVRTLLTWEMLISPIAHAWIAREFDTLFQRINNLRANSVLNIYWSIPTYQASLDMWEAYARTLRGGQDNFDLASVAFQRAIQRINTYLDGNDLSKALIWQAKSILATSYRLLGYLQRQQGLIDLAITNYKKALPLLRAIDLRIELAIALNDLGFALTQRGQWTDARALVNDAKEMRRDLGMRGAVALSLNTLAQIELYEGRFEISTEYSERALALGRALVEPRVTGLALIAMAEAQRRLSKTDRIPNLEDKINLLRAARDQSEEALRIFKKHEEKTRQVEALIEIGCACRDWAKLRLQSSSSRDDIRRLVDESQKALREAASEAGTTIRYRQVDAWVNLAWLGYFISDDNLIKEAATMLETIILPEERIRAGVGEPRLDAQKSQMLIWPQIGKLEILYGHRQYERLENSINYEHEKLDALLKAIDHYFLGLQYSSLYSKEYRDINIAKDQIYEHLKKLPSGQLTAVTQRISELKKEYNIRSSELEKLLGARALVDEA